jgi:arabinogalactan oligomer / maltooligosaccharide transport system substrate-binding protein
MHRTTKLVSALGALAIVVAACGGGASPTPAASTPAESTAPAETAAPTEAAFPTGDFKLLYWTKEGGDSLKFVEDQAAAYTALHPNVTFEIVNKDVEVLREDFQTASLAGEGPDLLWTVADHVGVFTAADLIQPLDDIVDKASYVPAAADIVTAEGKLWGAPISFGNQLMLYWNKSLAGDTAPADSDAWIAKAKELTTADGSYGIVFNQTESFWLVPFLGGYGGSVFAADGITPTLNTEAMTSALQFMYDLKYTDKVMPAEADYNVADSLFKDAKAAFIVNGDWAMSGYAAAPDAETPGLGDNLGVAPIPQLTGAGWPAPYIAGAFFMIPKAVADNADKQFVVSDFVNWATGNVQQTAMVAAYKRLPGNATTFTDPIVVGDALLKGAAEAATKGVPQPTNLEMRCVFDSMTAGVRDLYTGNSDVAGIAATMQTSAETCISQQ